MERAEWEQLVALTIESDELVYAKPDDRFLVFLVVGYSTDDGVPNPVEAGEAALRLTTDDGGSADTHWVVYDRETNEVHEYPQRVIEPEWLREARSRGEAH